jgi:hypothetical protein
MPCYDSWRISCSGGVEAGAEVDHFGDTSKMVGSLVAGLLTGLSCLVYNLHDFAGRRLRPLQAFQCVMSLSVRGAIEFVRRGGGCRLQDLPPMSCSKIFLCKDNLEGNPGRMRLCSR